VKFRFDDQPHQAAAVSAVADLFEGALVPPRSTLVGWAPGAAGHAGFTLEREILSDNLRAVTLREAVAEQSVLELLAETDLEGEDREFPNFSVEMETGTGKTYVYISTALRMAELYGLRKFVILPTEWTEASGHLTPKMSIKRNVIMADFSDEVDELYSVPVSTSNVSLS